MPFSDPADRRDYNRAWMRADRKKKRAAASMTIAERIRAGRALAEAAGLARNSESDNSPSARPSGPRLHGSRED